MCAGRGRSWGRGIARMGWAASWEAWPMVFGGARDGDLEFTGVVEFIGSFVMSWGFVDAGR